MNQQNHQEQTVQSPTAIIERGPIEQIRFSVQTYKGHRYLDVRTYFENGPGEWKPTKKGVTFALDQLDDLEAAVAALRLAVAGEQRQDMGKAA